MTHIKLYRRGEGCEMPDGSEYLMVLARQVDTDGNWLSTEVQSFQSICQLREALREIVATRDGIVIRGSSQFWQLAQELGLPVLTAEWGKL